MYYYYAVLVFIDFLVSSYSVVFSYFMLIGMSLVIVGNKVKGRILKKTGLTCTYHRRNNQGDFLLV